VERYVAVTPKRAQGKNAVESFGFDGHDRCKTRMPL
jgi:hypothetical protein